MCTFRFNFDIPKATQLTINLSVVVWSQESHLLDVIVILVKYIISYISLTYQNLGNLYLHNMSVTGR